MLALVDFHSLIIKRVSLHLETIGHLGVIVPSQEVIQKVIIPTNIQTNLLVENSLMM